MESVFRSDFNHISLLLIKSFRNSSLDKLTGIGYSITFYNIVKLLTNRRRRGQSSSTTWAKRQRWNDWEPGQIPTNFPNVPRSSIRRSIIGVATPDTTRWPFTTRAGRAKWGRLVTKWRWSTQGWGCTVSRGCEWSTPPSCPRSFLEIPTRRRSWSRRRLPTWLRRTGELKKFPRIFRRRNRSTLIENF